MKVNVYNLDGEPEREIELPSVFNVPYRPDIIRRAFIAISSSGYQPQGRDPMAGKRTSAESWGTGHGVARVPRIKGSRHPASGKGAFAPMTVGGRRAHPPKAEKNIVKLINKKEKTLALKSAIASTANIDLVKKRGHIFDESKKLPLVVVSELEKINSAKEIKEIFKNIDVWADIERVKNRKRVRSGKGKMRGRKYKRAVGPLIVISEDKGIVKAARNFPGVDIVKVKNLSVKHLAPGGVAGRLTIWTQSAIDMLKNRFNEG